jgi:hypothetical protein
MRRYVQVCGLAMLLACGAFVVSARAVKANGPCDVSGAWTDRLCPRDHLLTGYYLESPNHNYRLVYQADGAFVIYDVSGSPWIALTAILTPTADAGWIIYSDVPAPSGLPAQHYAAYKSWGQLYAGQGWTSPGGDGVHFMAIEDDGAVRVYDQGGSRCVSAWNGTC